MKKILWIIVGAFVVIFFNNCSTGVESSPKPGILQVILHGDDSDTSIVIIDETYSVDTSDVFMIHIFEGKAYQNKKYAELFPTLDAYHNPGHSYNILARDSTNQLYLRYKIFETYVPPGNYTRLQIGITAKELRIGEFDPIPVFLPPEDSLLVNIDFNFSVEPDHITQIDLALSPFRSIQRYKDMYLFKRIVEVQSVKILKRK
ncbi:MAG: hypothetical protein J7L94_02530 [Caldisericaceae bacterium]|nr:hypothetical protein [Caldisericaceae bacterium]